MRTIGLIVVVVVVILGIGLYFGWFSVRSTSDDGTAHVTLSVDKDKVHQDEAAVKADAQHLEHAFSTTTQKSQ